MSDATLYTAATVEESTYGTTPASALQLVNVTEFNLQRNRTVNRPNILTGDYRRYPNRVLQEDGALTAPAPLQYENFILWQEGVLSNDRGAAVSASGTDVAIDGSTGAITTTSTSLSNFSDGDLIYMSGNSTNADGWYGPVTSAGALTITVPAGQVSTEAAGNTVTLKTRRLVDGSTPKYYSNEWQDTGLTNKFRSGTGYVPTQYQLNWQQGQYANESVTFAGKAPSKASATIGTGSATAAPTSSFMNAVQDWGTLYIAESATTYVISQLQLQITNVQNAIRGLGNLGPSAMSRGPMDISLTAQVLYDDNSDTLLGNIEAQDTLAFWWDVVDLEGNRMAFFVPAGTCDGGPGPTPGQAGNLTEFELQVMGFDPAKGSSSAYTSAGFGFQIGIFYVPAA